MSTGNTTSISTSDASKSATVNPEQTMYEERIKTKMILIVNKKYHVLIT